MSSIFTSRGDFDRAERLYNELLASEEEDAKKEEQEEEVQKKQNQASIQDFYSNDRISPTSGFESELLSAFEEEKPPTITEENKPVSMTDRLKAIEEQKTTMPTKPPVLGSLEEYEARVKSGEGNIAPTEEEEAGSTKLGREFQEEEFSKAKADWAKNIPTQSEQKRQSLNEKLNAKLAEVEKSFEIANTKYDIDNKFREIQSNSRKSLDSIDNEIMKLSFNKAVAGTEWGKMKLKELMVEKDLVKQQSAADAEKLGVYAWESMSPDNKLLFGRLMQDKTIDPQSRIQYVNNNAIITKAVNGLEAEMKLIGIPDNLIEGTKDKILGKKLLVNGQVQYDQDNQPIRQDGGLVRKNKLGVYEPTVDMEVFKNGYDSIAKSFSPAKADGGGGGGGGAGSGAGGGYVGDAKSVLGEYDLNREAYYKAYKAAGGEKEYKDFRPEDAYDAEVIDEKELERINRLATAAQELLREGEILTTVEREEKKSEFEVSKLDKKLMKLADKPDPKQIAELGKEGKIVGFKVENNKLVPLSPDTEEGKFDKYFNNKYVTIKDESGAVRLVNVGGNLKDFIKKADELYFVNGEFTKEPPSLKGIAGTALRLFALSPALYPAAMGLEQSGLSQRFANIFGTADTADTEYNESLKQSSERLKNLQKAQRAKSDWDTF